MRTSGVRSGKPGLVPCDSRLLFLRFVVHGLTTGEQYIFRVKAVNAVGTSENSQESEVIKVQAALSM